MAKLKKIETGLRPEVRQPTRKLNIFQRGVKGIIHFIRPIKPELSNTATDPETSGSTNPEPVEDDGNTTSSSGGTTITDPGGSTSSTDPGADPTNPVNTEDMETFIGEIKMFAGNFAPRGWAFCEGQTLDIASHQALYSLIGTTYGGDGRVNFKLPDLRGRVPIHPGQGQGLSSYPLGSAGGTEKVQLMLNEMPEHSHSVRTSLNTADSPNPENNFLSAGDHNHYSQDNPGPGMNNQMISETGQGQAHNNMQPYLAINYIIALEGVYPSRT